MPRDGTAQAADEGPSDRTLETGASQPALGCAVPRADPMAYNARLTSARPPTGQHGNAAHGQDPPDPRWRQEAPLLPHHRHRQPQRARRPQHRARGFLQPGRRRCREARRAQRRAREALGRAGRADDRQGRRPRTSRSPRLAISRPPPQPDFRSRVARPLRHGHDAARSAGNDPAGPGASARSACAANSSSNRSPSRRRAIFRYQPWTLRDAQGRERELTQARGPRDGQGPGRDVSRTSTIATPREALRGTEV